jgi:predicted ATPase/transcriptional regulator with XRE-family HTH domain
LREITAIESDLTFGAWLRRRRKTLDLTRQALAARVSCSVSALRKFEADTLRPSRSLAEALAGALQLAPQEQAAFVRFARDIPDATTTRLPLAMVSLHYREPPATVRSTLPAQLTPLVGREQEVASVCALLRRADTRLLTLTGSGGVGKTRLALAAAAELAEAFIDGTAFIPLAAMSSATFLAPAILTVLDVALQGQRNPRDQLLEYLREKELLLVLDNFEQLLAPDLREDDSVAVLLMDMLQRASRVTLLVTSRERLALEGEWVFELAGLSYPPDEVTNGIDGYGAVQLFLQRASQVRRQFALAEGEARAVARICRLVEGLPLAVELAATGLRTRSCAAIADAIEGSLSVLANGRRAIPERHRSIWATFEHSWRLLSDEEQQVFRRLSVFRGGFEEDAAAEVAQATPQLLAMLVDKSILRWDGAARYDMHELVRQYAGDKLEEVGETERMRRHHAQHFLTLAEASEPGLRAWQVTPWLDRLTAERSNFRAALSWSRTSAGDCQLGLRIAGALEYYWMFRDNSEGRAWLEGLLAQEVAEVAAEPQRVGDRARLRARAKALGAAGMLAEGEGALELARSFLEESARACRQLEELPGLADSLLGLAHLAWTKGVVAHAEELAEECLRVSQVAGDVATAGRSLWLLSNILREQGDLAGAQTLATSALAHAQEFKLPMHVAYAIHSSSRVRLALGDLALARSAAEEALALGRQLGHTIFIAHALLQLGRVAAAEGDRAQAVLVWEQAIGIARREQHLRAMAEILLELGWVEHQQGNDRRATALLTESLRLYRDRGHQGFIAECLDGLAGVIGASALTSADVRHAARLHGAAEAIRGGGKAMLRPDERSTYQHDVTTTRARLGEAIFAAAWDEGRALTMEQSVVYALEMASQERDSRLLH